MNILQTRISSPEGDLNENDNGNELNEHRESAEVDDFLTFDISDDIVHYDINEIKKTPETDFEGGQKIFKGSNVTISAAMVLILSYSIRFSLSSTALSNLLLLFNLLLPKDSRLCKTLHHFRKHFQLIKTPMNYHHYCSKCLAKRSSSSLKNCANCGFDLTVTDNKGYFLEFPIANQLKSFFKRKDFYENLQYRFKHKKKQKGNLEDIYDREIYLKDFKDNGFLSNKDNISFLWNTDGVPLFKSSKISIWSIFLVINELPPSLHYKSENMVFAGIWYGTRKPEPTLFLEPLYREFEIMKKGILVDIPTETSGN